MPGKPKVVKQQVVPFLDDLTVAAHGGRKAHNFIRRQEGSSTKGNFSLS